MSDKNNIPESLRKYVLDEELVPPPSIVFYKGTDRQLTYWPVDREALLALADEMYAYSFHFSGGLQECTVQAWAQAIRKALGVDE